MGNRRAVKRILAIAGIVLVPCVAIGAAPSAAGQWRVEFATPLGERAVNMTINQAGTKLSGHVVDPYGEYELEGRIADRQVTAAWSAPEAGELITITMRGKLNGNAIEGTATIGALGEGPLSAHRTGDADDR